MAGAMRKMAVYLGLVEDDDRYDDYDDFDDHLDEGDDRDARRDVRDVRAAERPGPSRLADRHAEPHGATLLREERSGGVATLTERRPAAVPSSQHAGSLDRITTIHPRTYNEAKQIGESFRSGTPVIMNLTDMDDADAKRLVDFAAGLVFGLRGTIERVTAKVFLLSPANVSVTAEDKARMAESGFFNQS
jgi:cell division inhibitor SepF